MITTLLTTAALWFHTMATITLIGYYLLMTLVYLPVFNRRFSGKALIDLLVEINGAVRQRLYAALGMFAITGVYLTATNESYKGFGNFSNPWLMLMLVKHILILVMIGLVILFDNSARAGNERLPQRLNLLSRALSVCGIVVILLTAFAQA